MMIAKALACINLIISVLTAEIHIYTMPLTMTSHTLQSAQSLLHAQIDMGGTLFVFNKI